MSKKEESVYSKASRATQTLLRLGVISKPDKCEKCKSVEPLQGHHEDYTKLLEVTWLCARCHVDRHREFRGTKTPIPGRGKGKTGHLQPRKKLSRSGYIGVDCRRNKFRGYVWLDGKKKSLPVVATAVEAANMRDHMALKIYGADRAVLNFEENRKAHIAGVVVVEDPYGLGEVSVSENT